MEALNRTSIFCIGEMTAKTAKEAGLKVSAVSEVSTMDDLMDTMLHWLKASQAASELSPSNLN